MKNLDKKIFPKIIISGFPTVIYVSAEWCQPCKIFKPLVEKLEKEYDNKVNFYCVDADVEQELCGDLHITAIPTLLFFRTNIVGSTLVGVNPERTVKEKIEEILK